MNALHRFELSLTHLDFLSIYGSQVLEKPKLYYKVSKLDQEHLFIGSIRDFYASGPERFQKADQFLAHTQKSCNIPEKLILPCIYSFYHSPPKALHLFIPKWHLCRKNGQTSIIYYSFEKDNPLKYIKAQLELLKKIESPPSIFKFPPYTLKHSNFANYTEKVAQIIEDIKLQKYQKMVLAGFEDYTLAERFDVAAWLFQKSQEYPSSQLFAYQDEGSTFFGASPELLLHLFDNKLYTEALAGSKEVQIDPQADLVAQKTLLEDPKSLEEHFWVRNCLVGNLEQLDLNPTYPLTPKLRSLKHIHHLHTPIKCDLGDASRLKYKAGKILEKLHPSPALGSFPQEAYIYYLANLEGFKRGLYGGGLGFLGEESFISVNIRCGSLKDNQLRAYAGCGITVDSDPKTELLEIQTKLKALF